MKNLGNTDRMVRIVVALALGLLYMQDVITGTFGIVLVTVAVIFVATSFISFCPLYKIFGLSSRPKEK